MNQFIQQLESIISLGRNLAANPQYRDLSDKDESQIHQFLTQGRAAVERITGQSSVYAKNTERIFSRKDYDGEKVRPVIGILESLLLDILSGSLTTVRELLHQELFADLLEMADHLLTEGYKDAAAVISGSTLESHLRQLCTKNNIPIDSSTPSGILPKKADRINSELAAANIYSKLDQKSITAWLDLRNKAAHGHYADYSSEQVKLLIAGVRDFITRNPA